MTIMLNIMCFRKTVFLVACSLYTLLSPFFSIMEVIFLIFKCRLTQMTPCMWGTDRANLFNPETSIFSLRIQQHCHRILHRASTSIHKLPLVASHH
uniref:Uncharacterized protein n=1 Tax=Arundo donax TaxID=35708 RepID=A0A0A9CVD4_ARUDO